MCTGTKVKHLRNQIHNLNLFQKIYWHRDEDNERVTGVCLLKDEHGIIARGVTFWNFEDDFAAVEGKFYAIRRALKAYKKGTDEKSEIRNTDLINPDSFNYKAEFIGLDYTKLTDLERKFLKV